jgi:hypothetical protein
LSKLDVQPVNHVPNTLRIPQHKDKMLMQNNGSETPGMEVAAPVRKPFKLGGKPVNHVPNLLRIPQHKNKMPMQNNVSETPDLGVAASVRRPPVDFSKPPKAKNAPFTDIWDYLKASIEAFMDDELRVHVTFAHYMSIHQLVYECCCTLFLTHKERRKLYRLMKEHFNNNSRLNTALEVSFCFS